MTSSLKLILLTLMVIGLPLYSNTTTNVDVSVTIPVVPYYFGNVSLYNTDILANKYGQIIIRMAGNNPAGFNIQFQSINKALTSPNGYQLNYSSQHPKKTIVTSIGGLLFNDALLTQPEPATCYKPPVLDDQTNSTPNGLLGTITQSSICYGHDPAVVETIGSPGEWEYYSFAVLLFYVDESTLPNLPAGTYSDTISFEISDNP